MAEYPDKYFDLAVVDPPYGIGDVFIPITTGNKPMKLERTHKIMEWDNEVPEKTYFDELNRISKKQIIWGANYFNCFRNGGSLVWYKNNGAPSLSQCEIASLSFKKSVDYVYIQQLGGFVQKNKPIHPTQKPIALYKWLLQNYANEDDLILDTHVGSASSLIACIELGFNYVGYEIDKDYYKSATERIERFESQVNLFRKPARKQAPGKQLKCELID